VCGHAGFESVSDIEFSNRAGLLKAPAAPEKPAISGKSAAAKQQNENGRSVLAEPDLNRVPIGAERVADVFLIAFTAQIVTASAEQFLIRRVDDLPQHGVNLVKQLVVA
jgi:hypothetical protein